MAVYTDWLPGSRTGQIEMAKNRIRFLTVRPGGVEIPPGGTGPVAKGGGRRRRPPVSDQCSRTARGPPMIIDENRKPRSLNLREDDTGKTFYYSGWYLNGVHEEGPYCPIQLRLIP